MHKTLRYITTIILLGLVVKPVGAMATEVDPIIIGLDADMSAGAAEGGLSIQRGAEIAIAEINEGGGVLGRPLQLKIKDHRGNPVRGANNIKSYAAMDNLVAVLGGVHTPVAMHELPLIHQHKIIYLGPWAAGTPVVKNGYQPNYVFRVSIRDEFAGAFLVEKALQKGYRKVALALEKTGWGRSNEKAMRSALTSKGLEPAEVAWFHWGARDQEAAVDKLIEAKPDIILLVANAPEGLEIAKSMASHTKEARIPIISHWGITGGNFYEQAKDVLGEIDLSILQTFSFVNPPFPDRAERVVNAYLKRYPEAVDASSISSPTGTAHAYDLIHLLALAIAKAGTTDRESVRNTLENLEEYQGLVRNYSPAFTSKRHDALDSSDFNLSQYDENGVIIPLP